MNLYPYQVEGVKFLTSDLRRYLADTMGLGKTVQSIEAANEIMGATARIGVIAPASVLPNWQAEVERYATDPSQWHFVSYNRLASRTGIGTPVYDLVIIDEAHYAKNNRAKRTIASMRVARASDAAWLLSGTPMPNHPGELWPAIRTLWPHVPKALGLNSYSEWFNFFCLWSQTKYGPRVYGTKNLDKLRPYLETFMLRRTLDDVALDLPPLRVDVQLLPKDKLFEAALRADGVDGARLMQQIERETNDEDGSSSRARRLLGTYKAPRVADILAEELDAGEYHQIVVLAYHRNVLDTLRQKLRKFGVAGFDGSTPADKRQEEIDRFRNGEARVFIAQQTAAGVGINLQNAHEIVLLEPAWSPDDNRQAIKRVHRIGSTQPVRARIFGIAGSMDAGIMRAVANKAQMQSALGL